jgi:para-nitrobenzyl esterase
VPVINGTNHDEWRLFISVFELERVPVLSAPVTAANYRSMIASTLDVPGPVAAVMAALYPLSAYPSPALALGAVGTDAIFACPALTVDRSLSQYVPTYAYEFNDENAPELFLPPASFPYGAAHTSELQYLFDFPSSAFPSVISPPQQQQLAVAMKRYWTNLAKHGFPSSSAEPRWPRFAGASHRVLSLIPSRPHVETGFAAEHHCAFWAPAGKHRSRSR